MISGIRHVWLGFESVVHAQRGEGATAPWILAVGAVESQHRPLVLLIDLQQFNGGASLSNTVEFAVAHATRALFADDDRPATAIDWVELDSDGYFDEIVPSPDLAMLRTPFLSASFKPLIAAAGTSPRTLRAFLERHGARAQRAWEAARTLVFCVTGCSFETAVGREGREMQRLVPAPAMEWRHA